MELIKLQVSCLIILLFIAAIYFKAKRLKTKTGDCFSKLILAMILNISLDAITVITINHRDVVPAMLNRALCAAFQESLILVLLLNSNYVFYMIQEEAKSYKTLKVINYVPFVITTLVNILIPVQYNDTPNGTYTYGWPANVCYTSVVIYVIISSVRLCKHFKEISYRKRNITIASLVIFIVTAGYGATNPTLLIHGFGLTLIVFAAFLTVESPDARLIELLQIEKDRADDASKAKGRFLANMSHEIRTPINAVLGLDTMILRESKEPEIRKYALDIQSAGRSLLSLINDILDFSKIESGKMQLVYGEYGIASVINDIFNMIRPKVLDKGLDFVIHIDENMPSRFIGDDVRIKQIIVNLLTNAVKYTHEGQVELSISSIQEDDKAYITVHVKDTGIGIKPEDIHKLSEEFVRIEESRNKNIEGTGLGISIVINLLQLMGSKLEVSSVYGEGSDFYFTISQSIKSKEAVGNLEERLRNNQQEEEYCALFTIPDCRLLVVDDNAMNRNVFANLLKEMQCSIDEAESGKQCLELVEKEKYDIIFMDHMMPEMDGIETYRHMKQKGDYLNVNTPVIILTANAISGAREEYLSEGFSDYLSKPIDAEKLEGMIGKMIPDEKKKKATGRKEEVNETQKLAIDLPFIDGIDWENAMQRLKSEKLLQDSIDGFSLTAKSDMSTLKAMYNSIKETQTEDAFSAYRIQVHSMKSNVATIGANHVAGLAKYLEYAARDLDLSTIDNLMPLFEKEWHGLKQSIDEAFGKNDDSADEGKSQISNEELFDYLDLLLTAVEEFDLDRADAIMDELSEHSYPVEKRELMEELKVAARNMDTDECVEIVNKIKSSF